MLNICPFLWGESYTWADVERLGRQLAQHVTVPYRLTPITATGEEPGAVSQAALEEAAGAPGHHAWRLRRLPLLSAGVRELIGPRILQIDLDVDIVANIDHLFTDEPLRIYRCPSIGRRRFAYAPGLMLMDAGVLDELWQRVKNNPVAARQAAVAEGWTGTDQAIIGRAIHPHPHVFTGADGVYSYRDQIRGHARPANACLIQCYGKDKGPWRASS